MDNAASKENVPKTPIRFFLHVSKPYAWWAYAAIAFVVIAASGSVAMRFLIEFLIAGIEIGNAGEVVFWGLMYPVIFFWYFIGMEAFWYNRQKVALRRTKNYYRHSYRVCVQTQS